MKYNRRMWDLRVGDLVLLNHAQPFGLVVFAQQSKRKLSKENSVKDEHWIDVKFLHNGKIYSMSTLLRSWFVLLSRVSS